MDQQDQYENQLHLLDFEILNQHSILHHQINFQEIDEVLADEEIKQKNKLFGRVIINEDYPFGIIRFKDSDIQISNEFDCGNAKIKIILPSWLDIKN